MHGGKELVAPFHLQHHCIQQGYLHQTKAKVMCLFCEDVLYSILYIIYIKLLISCQTGVWGEKCSWFSVSIHLWLLFWPKLFDYAISRTWEWPPCMVWKRLNQSKGQGRAILPVPFCRNKLGNSYFLFPSRVPSSRREMILRRGSHEWEMNVWRFALGRFALGRFSLGHFGLERFDLKIISRWTFWQQFIHSHFPQIRKTCCLSLSHCIK